MRPRECRGEKVKGVRQGQGNYFEFHGLLAAGRRSAGRHLLLRHVKQPGQPTHLRCLPPVSWQRGQVERRGRQQQRLQLEQVSGEPTE